MRNSKIDDAIDKSLEVHGFGEQGDEPESDDGTAPPFQPKKEKKDGPADGDDEGSKDYSKMTVSDLKAKLSPEDQAKLDELLAKC